MNAQTKLMTLTQQRMASAVKAKERLKARLLLGFGVFVLCMAVMEYALVKVQPAGAEIKQITFVLTVLLLPAYFTVLFISEYLRARRQRKRLARMIAQLTANMSTGKEAGTEQRRARGQKTKGLHPGEADTLVQKIVQVINA